VHPQLTLMVIVDYAARGKLITTAVLSRFLCDFIWLWSSGSAIYFL